MSHGEKKIFFTLKNTVIKEMLIYLELPLPVSWVFKAFLPTTYNPLALEEKDKTLVVAQKVPTVTVNDEQACDYYFLRVNKSIKF